jgi:Uma2 family endonuclease
MAMTAKMSATYAELLALPAHVVGEIVDGDLPVSPRPGLAHARAAVGIIGDLSGPFDRGRGGPGGWIFLTEPELHLGPDVVVPTIASWRRARMPELPDAPYTSVAPSWLCEVLSPSTARFDRSQKLAIYARAGVEHVWLVDPQAQLLEVLTLDGGGWRITAVFAGDAVVRAEPFTAVELELARLWAK